MIIIKNKLKTVILHNFAFYKMFREMFFFSSQIFLKEIFCIAQGFLYKIKILILQVLLLKWNKRSCIDLFKISLGKYSLFLSHVK